MQSVKTCGFKRLRVNRRMLREQPSPPGGYIYSLLRSPHRLSCCVICRVTPPNSSVYRQAGPPASHPTPKSGEQWVVTAVKFTLFALFSVASSSLNRFTWAADYWRTGCLSLWTARRPVQIPVTGTQQESVCGRVSHRGCPRSLLSTGKQPSRAAQFYRLWTRQAPLPAKPILTASFGSNNNAVFTVLGGPMTNRPQNTNAEALWQIMIWFIHLSSTHSHTQT